MSWDAEIEELERRRQWADALGGEDRVKRHHERGCLTVRERIAGIADAGSFREIGKLAGKGTYAPDKASSR